MLIGHAYATWNQFKVFDQLPEVVFMEDSFGILGRGAKPPTTATTTAVVTVVVVDSGSGGWG